MTSLQTQALELIENEDFADVFDLFQQNKDFFKDFQSFRDKFLHDYMDYSGIQKKNFKDALRVFVRSKKSDSTSRQDALPTFSQESLNTLIDKGLFAELFAELQKVYNRMDSQQKPTYHQLKEEFTQGVSKTDIRYTARLRVFVSGLTL